jgi:hypothetical protein
MILGGMRLEKYVTSEIHVLDTEPQIVDELIKHEMQAEEARMKQEQLQRK